MGGTSVEIVELTDDRSHRSPRPGNRVNGDAGGPRAGSGGWTAANAYLVTAGQFRDVAAQEIGTDHLDLDLLDSVGTLTLGDGWYQTLISCGRIAGRALYTFTRAGGVHDATLNAPAPAYATTITTGLADVMGWTLNQARRHLNSWPGAAGPRRDT